MRASCGAVRISVLHCPEEQLTTNAGALLLRVRSECSSCSLASLSFPVRTSLYHSLVLLLRTFLPLASGRSLQAAEPSQRTRRGDEGAEWNQCWKMRKRGEQNQTQTPLTSAAHSLLRSRSLLPHCSRSPSLRLVPRLVLALALLVSKGQPAARERRTPFL
jgi:hypothetical protein